MNTSSLEYTTDLHIHTVASGHGTTDPATEVIRQAAARGMTAIGITDHAPAFPGSCKASYFRSLFLAPKIRYGLRVYYGAELNILDAKGKVDLPEDILEKLDYSIISLHNKVITPDPHRDYTDAYIGAMDHPKVLILGHPDDGTFPADYERLLAVAKKKAVFPELNNASLMPDAYRKDCAKNDRIILEICRRISLPIFLSSDSHGGKGVGDFGYGLSLLRETNFPKELILNGSDLNRVHPLELKKKYA